MNQINEFRDMISYCQIFNDQPKGCKEQAQNVSNAWYSFSRFIPGFLSELKTKINNDEIVFFSNFLGLMNCRCLLIKRFPYFPLMVDSFDLYSVSYKKRVYDGIF